MRILLPASSLAIPYIYMMARVHHFDFLTQFDQLSWHENAAEDGLLRLLDRCVSNAFFCKIQASPNDYIT